MNRHELITENKDVIHTFVKNGIISYMILRDIDIYNEFLLLGDAKKELKYIILADKFELSIDRIKQIVYSMSSEVI